MLPRSVGSHAAHPRSLSFTVTLIAPVFTQTSLSVKSYSRSQRSDQLTMADEEEKQDIVPPMDSAEVEEKAGQILSLTAKEDDDSAALQMAERSKRTDASGSVPPTKDSSILARKADQAASATRPGAMSVGPSDTRTKRSRNKASSGDEDDAAVVAHAMSIGAASSEFLEPNQEEEEEEDAKPKAKHVPTLYVPPPEEEETSKDAKVLKNQNTTEQFKDETPVDDKENTTNDNETQDDNSDLYTIEATVVPSDVVLQEQARQQILNEAVEAKVMKIEDSDFNQGNKRNAKKWILIIGILLVVAALMGVILGIVLSRSGGGSSTTSTTNEAQQQDPGPSSSPPPPGEDDPFMGGGGDDRPPPPVPDGCSAPDPDQTVFLDVDGNVIPPPVDAQGNPLPYPTTSDGKIKPPPQDADCNYLPYPDKPPREGGGGDRGPSGPPPPNRLLRGREGPF